MLKVNQKGLKLDLPGSGPSKTKAPTSPNYQNLLQRSPKGFHSPKTEQQNQFLKGRPQEKKFGSKSEKIIQNNLKYIASHKGKVAENNIYDCKDSLEKSPKIPNRNQGNCKTVKIVQDDCQNFFKSSEKKFRNLSTGNENCKVLPRSSKKTIFNRLLSTQQDSRSILSSDAFDVLSRAHPDVISKNLNNFQSILKVFTYEFSICCYDLDHDATGCLNYSKFCFLLMSLRFIEDSFKKTDEERQLILKAWKILGGHEESKVKIDNLYLFLLGVMNLNVKSTLPNPDSNKSRSKRFLMLISKQNSVKLHQEFYLLYHNRIIGKTEKSISLNHSFPEQNLSETSEKAPEVQLETSCKLSDSQEHGDFLDIHADLPVVSSHKKLIRRISLREIASTPKLLSSKKRKNKDFGHSICETPKNLSFNGSECGDLKIKTPPLPSDINSPLINFKVQIVSGKNPDESFRKELNQSVSCARLMSSGKNNDVSMSYKPGNFKIQMHTVDSHENSVDLDDLEGADIFNPILRNKLDMSMNKLKNVKDPNRHRGSFSKTKTSYFN